jgi:hypothetical protein
MEKEPTSYVNTWTNDFNDRITFMGSHIGKGSYTITINGKYIKSFGGINIAKAYINEFRKHKCKWVASFE